MKKFLAILLVLTLVLGSTGIAAGAAFTDTAGLSCDPAVRALTQAKILSGYGDGTFHPNDPITRAEVVKILVESLGYGNAAKNTASKFSDTQGHWADGYIALGTSMGLIKGFGNNTFRPKNQVSGYEAVTFLVRAMGYTDEHVLSDGGVYPDTYVAKAKELGIIGDLKITSKPITRGEMATLLYQAWEKPLGQMNDNEWVQVIPIQTMKMLALAAREEANKVAHGEAIAKTLQAVAIDAASDMADICGDDFATRYGILMNSGQGQVHENYSDLLKTVTDYRMERGVKYALILTDRNPKDDYVEVTVDGSETPSKRLTQYPMTDALKTAFSGTACAEAKAWKAPDGNIVGSAYAPIYSDNGRIVGVAVVAISANQLQGNSDWIYN